MQLGWMFAPERSKMNTGCLFNPLQFWENIICIHLSILGHPLGLVLGYLKIVYLGGFTYFFLFLPGEMIQFDEHIFQMGWFNHHLDIPENSIYLSPSKWPFTPWLRASG